MPVIGLDVGTSAVKCTLFSNEGTVCGQTAKPYPAVGLEQGFHELPADGVAAAIWAALAEVAAAAPGGRVDAICATSLGESVFLLDAEGRPTTNPILYIDPRGAEAFDAFGQRFGRRRIFDVTGQVPHLMHTVFKLRWLQEQGRLQGARALWFVADYALGLLGGDHCTDYTLAARSCMFDIAANAWWDQAVAFAGVDPALLPRVVPSGSVVGELSAAAAHKIGLRPGAKLVIGGHDQSVVALGAGAQKAGQVMNGLGSVDNMTVLFAKDQKSTALMEHNFCVMPCALPGCYATYLYNFSGGALVRWFQAQFARELAPGDYAALDREAPDAPTGLLVMPHLGPTGTPYLDNHSAGIVVGLRQNTTRGELYRAFLEGEALEMRQNFELLEQLGIQAQEIITVGGGARSDYWMQLRADVFGKPVVVHSNSEAGTRGSALLALVGAGLAAGLEEANQTLALQRRIFAPNPAHTGLYTEQYDRYKTLYRLSKDLME